MVDVQNAEVKTIMISKLVTQKDILEERIRIIKADADRVAMSAQLGWMDRWKSLIDQKIELCLRLAEIEDDR